MGDQPIKGTPIRVFSNQSQNVTLSNGAIDCRDFNAINVAVIVFGTPAATISVKGSDAEGGNYVTLPDPNASKTAVANGTSFDVIVGTAWVKLSLTGISSDSYTVIVTPYVAAGQTNISVTNTAAQNLSQVAGAAISLGQKVAAASLPVVLASDKTPAVDTELPAAAALADAAANPTTPTEGAAKLAFNGATWDRERIATVFKNVAAVAVTANTPVDLWAPAAGKKFRVLGYSLSLTVAGSVILKDNTTEALRTPLMAAGVGQASPPMGNGYLSALADNKLKIDVTASGSVSGYVFGTEE